MDLRARLDRVRARIVKACSRAGRSPADVVLVGVSKYTTLDHVRVALDLGLTDFGESRPQELAEKSSSLPGHKRGGLLVWHMIGPIQRNKARLVVEHADIVHSVDSIRLGKALSSRLEPGDQLDCLVQVNISSEDSKNGFEPDSLVDNVAKLALLPGIRIKGLMGMAAYFDDVERTRPQFQLLRSLRDDLSRQGIGGIELHHLSMGMSNDFEVAIEEGATIVRVGTAIFGERSQA